MIVRGLSDVAITNVCKVDSKYCNTIVTYRLMKWLVARFLREDNIHKSYCISEPVYFMIELSYQITNHWTFLAEEESGI